MIRRPNPETFEGKTYSLRPNSAISDEYYETVRRLTENLLRSFPNEQELLAKLQVLGHHKRALRRLLTNEIHSNDSQLLKTLRTSLNPFTSGVQSHLRSLRGFDRWSRTLTMSEEQYHLAMVEIELVNRIYAAQFRSCGKKYAFLPHCLRDLGAECRSAQRDIDYVCKGCSESCNVNHASKTLRLHGVKPYIWMTADLSALFRKVKKEGNSMGVLGIACVPELVRGMRMCLKHDVPVVGIPLDANRCARWWGEFHWNTVNLEKLESLLKN
ncbi:MAG: DUF116 domain-containing protein [Ignavibacteriales bacterium]|nr:DUF116 domain-containing protein [Ignavibacteriales bacterium]